MPHDLELIPESVLLYNETTTADGKSGLNLSDDIIKNGAVSIGGYERYGEAYIRFKAKVTDTKLVEHNILRTWIIAQSEDVQVKAESDVVVVKQYQNQI